MGFGTPILASFCRLDSPWSWRDAAAGALLLGVFIMVHFGSAKASSNSQSFLRLIRKGALVASSKGVG